MAGDPWRKKVQDEKTRAKVRMNCYTNAQLADAFNVHLPIQFKELTPLLQTRALAPRE
jgi:hypothetical protein